ncbi:SDR family NAD(P)-dependent oxidoreductase [Conexibacter sp. S30A1]|uniref:SDR family NAD(P)-dependent oxidoreductase n=1 Tax=Conexibacter sp. S30A1 TaxID=2937800 RepID=UPI00200BF9AE|nr:SDR family oxidoreductase [Conexibacter sp. S30A1]
MSQSAGSYIVTGAAGGVGAAAVRQIADRGGNVMAVDLDHATLARAVDAGSGGGELVLRPADASREDDVRAYVAEAVDRWGGLAGVFNIAGIEGEFAMSGEASTANYDRVMSVNARSVFLNLKYVIPVLVKGGGGAVVSTGSHLAWHGAATLGAYCASKHAVMGLTRAAALEYATSGIRVNCVCPSAVDTAMGARVSAAINPDDVSLGRQVLIDQAPNGRLATPDEVAAAGVWLLLDAPSHINGILVPVDGGQAAA